MKRHPVFDEIRPGASADFTTLYSIYADLFPLADEREPPSAFFDIYALNERPEAQFAFGPWREVTECVRPWRGGPIVGGNVFGVTSSEAHIASGCGASIQAIYTFLALEARGSIPMAAVKRHMEDVAIETFFETAPSAQRPLIFLEVNNPLKMTREEIEADTVNSGVNPFRRYLFWMRSGFAPLDFPYVQPRLRADAEPVRYLDLFCSVGRNTVPASVLRAHMRSFVAMSVLKGREPEMDEDYRAMDEFLAGRAEVDFKSDVTDIVSRARQIAKGG